MCRQSQNRTTLSNQKQGWILRIQKFRERIDLWLLYANLLLNVLYHIEIEMKIRESCLQTGNFIYKPGISLTKQDFHLQRGSLGLQRGFSGYYLPCYLPLTISYDKNIINYDKQSCQTDKNNCHTEALYDTEESFKGTQGRAECQSTGDGQAV